MSGSRVSVLCSDVLTVARSFAASHTQMRSSEANIHTGFAPGLAISGITRVDYDSGMICDGPPNVRVGE